MPELPDLQVFSRNLDKKLKGKTVKRINIPVTKKLKVSAAVLKKKLEKQKIKKIYREGKELHIEFSKGDLLGLHLMLHGDLYFFEGKNEHKHAIIEILFTDNTGLVLTDWQRMATPTLNPVVRESPDALSTSVNYTFLKKALGVKTTIKNLLLNQDVIRGIGSAYADEILWTAGISPFSVSNKIPDEKIKALVKAIRKVLKDAERKIIRKQPDIISGEIRDFMVIHNARKKQSPGGARIEHTSIGGRKTYYTREQKLYK